MDKDMLDTPRCKKNPTGTRKLPLIREVLARYFEAHSNEEPSETFDEDFTAQEALDEIASIVETW